EFTVTVDVMRKLLVAAGALPPLIANLSGKNEDVMEQTLKVLTTLSLTGSFIHINTDTFHVHSSTEENELKLLNAGVLLPTIDLFSSASKDEIKEQAALLLSNLS